MRSRQFPMINDCTMISPSGVQITVTDRHVISSTPPRHNRKPKTVIHPRRLDLHPTESWRDRGECRGFPTEWWFSNSASLALLARAICSVCPVWKECEEASKHGNDGPEHGIWAGDNVREHKRYRGRAL